MRADIRRMLVKGKNNQLVGKIIAYVSLKYTDRIIITRDQHAALVRCANMGPNVVLCCGDTIVHYNHEPIDESYHAPVPVPRYKAELPPVVVNPFGVPEGVKTVPAPLPRGYSYGDFADDDIPF